MYVAVGVKLIEEMFSGKSRVTGNFGGGKIHRMKLWSAIKNRTHKICEVFCH